MKYDFGVYGAVTSDGIFLILDKYKNNGETFKHELIHMLLAHKNKNYLFRPEYAWLQEGIAAYYSDADKSKDNSVKFAAMTNNLPDIDWVMSCSLEEMMKEWRYSLYNSIVAFIVDKYGENQLFIVVNEIDKRTLYDILNTNKEDFYSGWQKYIIDNY